VTDGIFVIQDQKLRVLTRTSFRHEEELQKALEAHPDVIAGVATSSEVPRLLLVSREAGVASADSNRAYALDHLFVDHEGTPVLVEVKLRRDTRIRREVVGQLLDYAALGVAHWTVSDMRAAVAARLDGQTEAEALSESLGTPLTPDEFWQRVGDNLERRRIRLVFVADELPRDLVTVIEFLNDQMRDVEVLGVEVPKFAADGVQALVPRVYGKTSRAVEAKGYWNRATFLQQAQQYRTAQQVDFMTRLLDDVERRGARQSWGKGKAPGITAWYSIAGSDRPVWNLSVGDLKADGRAYLYWYLSEVQPSPGFDQFVQALRAIPALKPKLDAARDDEWRRWPSVYLNDLAGQAALEAQVFAAVDALVTEDGTARER
jgi:hypothetical protein